MLNTRIASRSPAYPDIKTFTTIDWRFIFTLCGEPILPSLALVDNRSDETTKRKL